MGERVQKLLAAAGLCSRREAEKWVQAGRVTVNGAPAVLGAVAAPERDIVAVDGKPLLQSKEKVYIMLNKPKGYVTTLKDEKGRRTVADLVQDCGRRVFPVGRLDLNSEGLLLLTNDGAVANRLMHPSHQVDKTYQVLVSGADTTEALKKLCAMETLDGEPIRRAEAGIVEQRGEKWLLSITIHEGKNRQVRRMCAACGLFVHGLKRVSEGPLRLGKLRPGCWRYLSAQEIRLIQNA